MARPRYHDAATADELIRLAAARLRADGLEAVTVRGVAADAGVSTRAVYSLFGSLAGLRHQLYLAGYARIREGQAAVLASDDPIADLIALGRAYRATALDNPALFRLTFGPVKTETIEAEINEALLAILPLHHAVKRTADAGQLVGDVDRVVAYLWSSVHGLALLEVNGFSATIGIPNDEQWEFNLSHLAASVTAHHPQLDGLND